MAEIDLDNNEFQQVLSLIKFTNNSVFMTGKAGTGKSTFLKYITEHTHKKYVVLAPTGIAAVNAGGQTLHSFFHIPLKPLLDDDREFAKSNLSKRMHYSRSFIKMLRALQLIIIDEISMVRADIIDFVDKLLRHFCGNERQPFAGKQILMVGDVFQLEPVVTSETREILRRDYQCFYFFGARVFRDFAMVPIELRKVYRQSDEKFIALLDRVRSGNPSPTDLATINDRVDRNFDPANTAGDDMTMTIATRRDIVTTINETHLANLPTKEVSYQADVKDEFPESSYPTDGILVLKVGAQVVFIRNDMNHRWVNGTIGRISALHDDTIEVTLENGDAHTIEREVWENVSYTYDEEQHTIVETVKGTFKQFPVKLAWALTIHKSQGVTFRHVNIDFGEGAFAGGQSYVALSRCTSLEGITLSSPVRDRDIYVNPRVAEFSRSFNDSMLVAAAMKSARADSLYAEAAKAFDKGKFTAALKALGEAVEARDETRNRVFQRAVAYKLYELTAPQREADRLRAELTRQQQLLSQLACEYVSMGDDCLREGWDYAPALANYNKALRLDPLNYEARVGRGRALIQGGEGDSAVDVLKDATAKYNRYEAPYELGCYYLSISDFKHSITNLKKAMKRAPAEPRIHNALADAYDALGDSTQAEVHRRQAARLRDGKK